MRIITLFILAIYMPTINAQNQLDNEVIQVNAGEFQKLINSKEGLLLDVRTKSEFNAEHIEKSGQLNFYAFDFKKKLQLLPNDQPIYLYCNTGYRSQKAGEFLVKKGYKNVFNLKHGIMEWNLEELPVLEGDKSSLNKENMVTLEDYKEVINSDIPVFIDFYAPWCAPCMKMSPMIDSLKTEYHERIQIVKINADVSKKLVKELKLIGVPHFMLYKNNELLFQKEGTFAKEDIKFVFDSILNIQNENTSKGKSIDQEIKYNDFKEPLKIGDIAPNFMVKDQKGNTIELYKKITKGPVVMIFYRGQWCSVCNKHLAQLQEGLAEIKAKGAEIIAITPEKQEYINKTIVKTNITFPIFYDEGYKIMKAYKVDFIPEKKTTMKYNTFLNANLREAQFDDSQTLPVPATYIIGSDRKIKYVHFNPNYKDRAEIEDILLNL